MSKKEDKGTLWRDFERLVTRIESTLAPTGAVVCSPDRIKDLVTGKLREVDASIRSRIGTVDILITVECRRRGRRQDDTWIEQLASKKTKIGAARTIAVSNTPFSESAIKTAAGSGIALRRLEEITEAEIASWLKINQIESVCLHSELTSLSVTFYAENDEPQGQVPFSPQATEALNRDPLLGRVFKRVADGELLDAQVFWSHMIRTQQNIWKSVPSDGTTIPYAARVNLPRGACQMETVRGPRSVAQVEMLFNLRIETSTDANPQGQFYSYSDPERGPVIQRVEFDTRLNGVPITLSVQGSPTTRDIRVSLRSERSKVG